MVVRKTKNEEPKKDDTSIVRGIGDNSEIEISGKKLSGIVVKIEKIEARKAQILQELREEYADAKALGYDTKTIRKVVRERAEEPEKRKEQAELLMLYKQALGMLDDEE